MSATFGDNPTPIAPAPSQPARLAEIAHGEAARRAHSPVLLSAGVRLLEFALVVASGALVYEIYVIPRAGFAAEYNFVLLAVGLAMLSLFQALGLYTTHAYRTPVSQGLKIAGGLGLVFLAAIAGFFLAKQGETFSRVWLVLWFAAAVLCTAAGRILVYAVTMRMTRSGQLDRRTVIVGGGEEGEALLRQLTRESTSDLRIMGVFDDRMDERAPDVIEGYPRLGTVKDLVDFARHTRVDLVIFAMPITAEQRILQMLSKLWVLPVDIRLAAHNNKLRFRPRSYSFIGSVPVLDIFDRPMTGWDVLIKFAFDKIFSAIFLILLSPVMLLVALAIKLDSRGPILFRQMRHGFNNERIAIYKFRSMYVEQTDYDARQQVTRNDPRVTRVGRFIRKTSLDELPQLFNVLFKGNLSLVGPRPHAINARAADIVYDEVVDGYFARHRVRPGMTGWAQVNGWRGETDTPEKLQRRVEHDLYYIENWSILFDLYIVAITPFALIKAENAY